MDKHITVLAVLYLAFGVIFLLLGAFLFVTIAGAGWMSGDSEAIAITSGVGGLLGVLFLIMALPSLFAGLGLMRHARWARILALVLGAINLFNIPFGTALGIYTFWVLLNDQTQPLFGLSAPATPR
jgi:hypothetical protein